LTHGAQVWVSQAPKVALVATGSARMPWSCSAMASLAEYPKRVPTFVTSKPTRTLVERGTKGKLDPPVVRARDALQPASKMEGAAAALDTAADPPPPDPAATREGSRVLARLRSGMMTDVLRAAGSPSGPLRATHAVAAEMMATSLVFICVACDRRDRRMLPAPAASDKRTSPGPPGTSRNRVSTTGCGVTDGEPVAVGVTEGDGDMEAEGEEDGDADVDEEGLGVPVVEADDDGDQVGVSVADALGEKDSEADGEGEGETEADEDGELEAEWVELGEELADGELEAEWVELGEELADGERVVEDDAETLALGDGVRLAEEDGYGELDAVLEEAAVVVGAAEAEAVGLGNGTVKEMKLPIAMPPTVNPKLPPWPAL
jgi:hypothetical protein